MDRSYSEEHSEPAEADEMLPPLAQPPSDRNRESYLSYDTKATLFFLGLHAVAGLSVIFYVKMMGFWAWPILTIFISCLSIVSRSFFNAYERNKEKAVDAQRSRVTSWAKREDNPEL